MQCSSVCLWSGSSLEQIHIFALAHILRRPIIVYGIKYVKSYQGDNIGLARFQGKYLLMHIAQIATMLSIQFGILGFLPHKQHIWPYEVKFAVANHSIKSYCTWCRSMGFGPQNC